MSDLLRNALKGPGNTSYDAGRILWVIGTLAFIFGALTFQWRAADAGQSFDMIAFGTGFGGGLAAILTAGGFGINIKDRGVARASATLTSAQGDAT